MYYESHNTLKTMSNKLLKVGYNPPPSPTTAYTNKELRAMAKERKILHYYVMKKEEHCEVLGYKIQTAYGEENHTCDNKGYREQRRDNALPKSWSTCKSNGKKYWVNCLERKDQKTHTRGGRAK